MANITLNSMHFEDSAKAEKVWKGMQTSDGNFSFEKVIPSPKTEKECPEKYRNSVSGNNPSKPWFDWYKWNTDNWGTKWDASAEPYTGGNSISFETPWSKPSDKVFQAIADTFDTSFILTVYNEDGGYECFDYHFAPHQEMKASISRTQIEENAEDAAESGYEKTGPYGLIDIKGNLIEVDSIAYLLRGHVSGKSYQVFIPEEESFCPLGLIPLEKKDEFEDEESEYYEYMDFDDEYFFGYIYAGNYIDRCYVLDKNGNKIQSLKDADHLERSDLYILTDEADMEDEVIRPDAFEKYAVTTSQDVVCEYIRMLKENYSDIWNKYVAFYKANKGLTYGNLFIDEDE